MAYRCSFLDNEVYSAGDVNDVFACLTSGGVTFCDTENTLSDLNAALAEAVGAGVLADGASCKVIRDGDGYKISAGACFMNDGSVIIFDEDGQSIEVFEDIKNYVYLERNEVANSIDIKVSALPGGEGSIPLAEIDEAGEIYDRRKYAHSKVMLGAANTLKNIDLEFLDCPWDTTETVTIDIGNGNFSYIIIWGGTYLSQSGKKENRVPYGNNVIELTDGVEKHSIIGRTENLPVEYVYFKKNGQYVEIYLTEALTKGKYNLSIGVI